MEHEDDTAANFNVAGYIDESKRNTEEEEDEEDHDDNDEETTTAVKDVTIDDTMQDDGDDDNLEDDDDDDSNDDDNNEIQDGEGEPQDVKGIEKQSLTATTMDNVMIGGTVAKEALCLLDGFVESDNNMVNWERVTLFIKRLPATIGRAHVTTDKNFVGLDGGNNHTTGSNNTSSLNGKNTTNNKAVSRQHVRIDYRVPTSAGGCGHVQTKVGFRSEFFYNHTDDPIATSDIRILLPTTTTTQPVLPDGGFFTLTCMGKNRVLVNGKRIEPNETVWLQSGSAIRIASYLLYFVTPDGTDETGGRKTLQIRDDIAPAVKKRKLSLGVSSAQPAIIGSGTGEGIAAGGDSDEDNQPGGSFRGAASRSMHSEIESLSTDQLLLEMKAAEDADIWERRHQLIGSTLSYRAVQEATLDREWYEKEGGTVSRSAVMEWVASSNKFGEWVTHMLSKLEQKSYQASITKGMIKSGYIRTTSSGRYIKWIVPRTNKHNKSAETSVDKNDASERSVTNEQTTLPSNEEEDNNSKDSGSHDSK